MDSMPLTEKVLLYIENNLDKKLTLEKIAEELHYSKFYMARTFKEDTGCTLYKYIRGRRSAGGCGEADGSRRQKMCTVKGQRSFPFTLVSGCRGEIGEGAGNSGNP